MNAKTDKMQKSNQEPELCPHMSLWPLWGRIVVYCSFNSDEFRTDYDRCAIHDDWIKKDECPMNFTFEEVKNKANALGEKKDWKKMLKES